MISQEDILRLEKIWIVKFAVIVMSLRMHYKVDTITSNLSSI